MNNVMIILRGCPGSSKSTIVKKMVAYANGSVVVCSADNFHMIDGEYKWDASKANYAHESCKRLAEEACYNRVSKVIIDNTNIIYSELKPYLQMASEHQYDVFLIEASYNNLTAKELFERNVHGVSLDTIQTMKNKFHSNREIVEFIKRDFVYLNVEYIDAL